MVSKMKYIFCDMIPILSCGQILLR